MDEFIGTVKLFAGNFAPDGWFYCWGQSLPIQQYAALYSILGVTYGGDGRNNFNLPDLRGRVPVGVGQSPTLGTNHQLGERWGAETITLTPANLPISTRGGDTATGSIQYLTVPGAATAPVAVNQPSLGLNYIICWQGIYPTRP